MLLPRPRINRARAGCPKIVEPTASTPTSRTPAKDCRSIRWMPALCPPVPTAHTSVSIQGSSAIAADRPEQVTQTSTKPVADTTPGPPPVHEAALPGLLAIVVFGTVALAIARSKVKVPVAAPNVRVRKRGRHHRVPVTLPADVTPADLDAADRGTAPARAAKRVWVSCTRQ